jgi:cytochrome c
MDSFEVNKLIGAVLGTVFMVFSVALVSDAIFAAPVPEKPGFAIEAQEGSETEKSGPDAAAPEPIAALLASADATAGEAIFKRCQACHSGEKGGPNKIGPNLWGVVNRPVASHEGFAYSAGMKEFSQGSSVVWDYEHLSGFLTAPKAYVKGTAMGFAGLKKAEERANLIAYLRTLADTPAPLPEAAAPAPADASATAGEAVPGAAKGTTPPKAD